MLKWLLTTYNVQMCLYHISFHNSMFYFNSLLHGRFNLKTWLDIKSDVLPCYRVSASQTAM